MTEDRQPFEGKDVALVDIIVSPQVRYSLDSLTELRESILGSRFIQPLTVRPAPEEGKYHLIAGERRYRACEQLVVQGHKEFAVVPCHVMRVESDEAELIQMVENFSRKDLHWVDEAVRLASWVRERRATIASLARRLGRAVTWVQRRVNVAERMGPESMILVRQIIEQGKGKEFTLHQGVRVSGMKPEKQKVELERWLRSGDEKKNRKRQPTISQSRAEALLARMQTYPGTTKRELQIVNYLLGKTPSDPFRQPKR